MGDLQLIINAVIHSFGLMIEYVGVFLVIMAVLRALWHLFQDKFEQNEIRADLAKNIILALEFVIAADILLVTVAGDINEILQLGGIVLVRILLGYSLHKEIALGKIKKIKK
ncbi:DUF1622 domain-containing protein [Candidatus Nomurabacteria bacterium]|nr:DUF1622 domain-containing protein [Candidatus Nomurabacteria bacterium]